MSETEARSHDQKTLPPEMASAVNLLAHPLAGFAAMGAIGFGLAGHAMGMWLGSVAGATEAVRRLAEEADRPKAEPSKGKAAPKLRLVATSDIADASATAVRSLVSDARIALRDAAAVVADAIDETPAVTSATSPAARTRPAQPDDLKAISGIGPKLEKVLNGFGIWTYGQIAALSADEIAWLDDELGFAGRIGRDGWLDQARKLDMER